MFHIKDIACNVIYIFLGLLLASFLCQTISDKIIKVQFDLCVKYSVYRAHTNQNLFMCANSMRRQMSNFITISCVHTNALSLKNTQKPNNMIALKSSSMCIMYAVILKCSFFPVELSAASGLYCLIIDLNDLPNLS